MVISEHEKYHILCGTRRSVIIAEHSFESISNEEMKANAHLIAAAPELLNASIQALRYMQKTGINYDNADIYNSLDSAIKKALGL